MSSMIAKCGKAASSSLGVGGVHGSPAKLSAAVPIATCLSRHAAHRPPATTGFAGAPQRGQLGEKVGSVTGSVDLRSVRWFRSLSLSYLRNPDGPVTRNFRRNGETRSAG